jgi:hypothetical protein
LHWQLPHAAAGATGISLDSIQSPTFVNAFIKISFPVGDPPSMDIGGA